MVAPSFSFFFFNDTATTEIYTLSLHDALPIWSLDSHRRAHAEEDRRHRLFSCPASPRSGHGVGLSDGRHRGLAPGESGGQARGVCHSECWEGVDATGQGLSEESGLVVSQTSSHDG